MSLQDKESDENVLPASLINDLGKNGAFVRIHTLDKPLEVSMAVQGEGTKMEIKHKAKLTVELNYQ